MRRKIDRVLHGSHITDSVGTTLTADEYHSAVTIGLMSYASSDSRVSDIIEMRKERLLHT